MTDGISRGQLAMIAAALVVILFAATFTVSTAGLAIAMYGAYGLLFLLDALSREPFRIAGIVLLACVGVFLLFGGARATSHKLIFLVSRAVLLLLSAVAGVASLWFAVAALVTVAEGLVIPTALLACVWLTIAMVLVAFCAAGIKSSVRWHLTYRITFLATLGALVPVFLVGSIFARILNLD